MLNLLRSLPWPAASDAEVKELLTREWIVTNGLGGYASGTVGGLPTRRYHGILIAALPAPQGRTMMLNQLTERVALPDGTVIPEAGRGLSAPSPEQLGSGYLCGFRLDAGLPVWCYKAGDVAIEKRLLMAHLQNTTHVRYRLIEGEGPVHLVLRPLVHFRMHDAPVDVPQPFPYKLAASDERYELSANADLPPLRMVLYGDGAAFTLDAARAAEVAYSIEASRGYESMGDLWSPGYFHVTLTNERDVVLIASTESWETIEALEPDMATRAESRRRERLLARAHPAAREGLPAELVLAADQFIINPAGRVEDTTRAHAAGEEIRTVIAGYHWFTDWGRDTMISLEGLTLTTGRHVEAGYILRTFAYYIRDGLIPNMFPEGRKDGLYHTADATLWFFHAVDRYVGLTGDRETLDSLLPRLIDILEHHLQGTRFGIGVDPEDGLLRQGQEGYQLTWMDAKVGDWVVTPRRGKAVEINALWYNALRLLEGWVRELRGDDQAKQIAEHAERARRSFNRRFWYEQGGYLYDVVDGESGDDPALRPNQLFAISLANPVLERARWGAVVDVVKRKLLTPVGLRSLAPGHPDYKAKYDGDLRARDAAYHQGTVWAWLIGPFIDAWLKVHPDDLSGARSFLEGFNKGLHEYCLGTIAEIFDAEPPYTPRGCVAQAWSVAEVLRCWVNTARPDA